LWALDGRLESLERRGIDLQLISPSPRAISDDKQVIGVEIARLMNGGGNGESGQARVAAGLVAWVSSHWARQKKAADEIRPAIGEYGFQGACLHATSAAGRLLDLPVFANVWDTLERVGSARLHACDDRDHTRDTRPVHLTR